MKYLNSKWKKITAVIVASVMVLGVGGISAFKAVEASSFDAARAAARERVPLESELIKESRDDDNYSFEFFDYAAKETFSVKVERKDRSRIQISSMAEAAKGSRMINLDSQAVENIIREQFPDAQITSISLSEDDDLYTYEAVFSSDTARGQFWIDPETGTIMERVLRYGQPLLVMNLGDDSDDDSDNDATAIKPDSYISLAEARVIALEQFPDMQFENIKYDEDDDRLVIEAELYNDTQKIEIKIDAVGGRIIEVDYEDPDDRDDIDDQDDRDDGNTSETTAPETAEPTESRPDATSGPTETTRPTVTDKPAPALIGVDRVRQIVLAKVPGAAFYEIELDRDDGRLYYEGDAYAGGYEYEFEIDAYTGAIIDWEVDEIDDDDDDDDDDD